MGVLEKIAQEIADQAENGKVAFEEVTYVIQVHDNDILDEVIKILEEKFGVTVTDF